LLTPGRSIVPSVVLVRELLGLTTQDLADLLIANLDLVAHDLALGAVVAFTRKDVRVRRLPLR
jgi:hypothetical protein